MKKNLKYNLVTGDPKYASQYSTKRKVEAEFNRTCRFYKKEGWTVLIYRIGYAKVISPIGGQYEIYINRNF